MKREVRIIDLETERPVKRYDVTGKSDRYVAKLKRGLEINLNHTMYRIAIVRKGPKADRG